MFTIDTVKTFKTSTICFFKEMFLDFVEVQTWKKINEQRDRNVKLTSSNAILYPRCNHPYAKSALSEIHTHTKDQPLL